MATSSSTNPPVTVTSITDSQFTLKWEKNKDLIYQAFLKEEASGKDWQRVINKKNIGSVTVMGLKAGTKYIFKVQTSDDSGKVLWECGGPVKTKESAVVNPEPNPTYSLQFYLSGTVEKDGNRYTILPDIVRPYDNNGSMLVLNDEFGVYLHKTDGKTREGFFIDSKYISWTILDQTGLSARHGSMHVRNTDGKIANASAVLIKMLKNGSFPIKIRVYDPNNSKVLLDKTLTVEVKNPAWDKVTVTGVSLSTSSISLVCGQPFQLKATVSPADASNKAIAWSSEDSSIASVTTDGLVRALNSGTTTIKAVTADGARAALARVKVTSLAFHLCYNKSGGGYASDIAVPSIVRPYADNGKFNVGKKIVVYLYGYCGSDKGHYSINKSYVECTVADPTVLSIEMGTIGGGASPAISFKFLKNGTSDVTIKVKDPMGQRFLIQQTFTVEVNNSAWEKSSTLKATTVTGYSLGFKWEKMNDKNVRYNAYLKESKDKEWKKIADRCTDMSGIGCGGLKADTQYDFYYEIVDEKGKVLRHEECTARTSDKVLKVSNVTSGGFTIGWEPLADKNVTDYGVYLAGEGPGTAWCKKMKGIKSYTYTGLKPGIRYTTFVYAYGPDGKEVFTYEAADAVCIPFPADAKNIVLKPGITSCNGVYGEGAVGLDVNLGSQFNRKYFEVSFDYFISATDKDSVRNDNIITFDSSYRALGLIMREGSIFVTTNNGSKLFDSGIRYKKGELEHINLILIDGELVINSKLIKVGDIKWSPSNNILSSRNYSNGHAFKGQIKNLIVRSK